MTIKNNLSSGVKVVEALPPATYTTGQTVSTSDVDCTGFRWMYLIVSVGTNTTTADGTLTVSSAPTSGGSYTLITDDTSNLTGGASSNVTATMTLPGVTDDTLYYAEIDLDQFDNWLQFDLTNGTGGSSAMSAVVILSGAANGLQSVPLSSALEFQITTKAKAAY